MELTKPLWLTPYTVYALYDDDQTTTSNHGSYKEAMEQLELHIEGADCIEAQIVGAGQNLHGARVPMCYAFVKQGDLYGQK